MANCSRGCIGTPIGQATDICNIQIKQNCGEGCTNLPLGYSRLEVDAAGQLVVCSNVGGVCSCIPVTFTDSFSIVKYGGGSPDVIVPDSTLILMPLDVIERDPRNEWTILAGPTAQWTAITTGNYMVYGSLQMNVTLPVASTFQSVLIQYTVNTITPAREVIAVTQRPANASVGGPNLWLTRGSTWERFNAGDVLDFTIGFTGFGGPQNVIGSGAETFIKIIQVG